MLRIGERCGTAKSVCSAKIDFLRENQTKSEQNPAMALHARLAGVPNSILYLSYAIRDYNLLYKNYFFFQYQQF